MKRKEKREKFLPRVATLLNLPMVQARRRFLLRNLDLILKNEVETV